MKSVSVKELLPEYPPTRHLPWKPNTRGDRVVSAAEAAVIFGTEAVAVQEKVDGSNCGVTVVDNHPVIRNRTKILRKGDLSKNLNPSLAQFAAAFTWFYKNRDKFDRLASLAGPVSVYGEWMVQQHGMVYDRLPDWFIPFDVFDHETRAYLDPFVTVRLLAEAGFTPVVTDPVRVYRTFEELEELANLPSAYASGAKREGVYVKCGDGRHVMHRFKMVREGFIQGCLLGDGIKKNGLRPA